MQIFSYPWVLKYTSKLSKRDVRMPGFALKFILPRFLKALFLLPTVLFFLLSIFFIGKYKTIIYRPDRRHLNLLDNLKDVVVIGDIADRSWAKKMGYSFRFFYPFYIFSHLGINFYWQLALNKISPKRILFWSDYGLDQFLPILIARQQKVLSWCFQHGLFPYKNNNDLDGFDCDINVVVSKYQLEILKNSGYKGNVKICENLFSFANTIEASEDAWVRSGCPIVFVGPGYSHAPDLEIKIVDLLVKLKKLLEPNFQLIYRNHPRDNAILKKIKKIGIACSKNSTSSFMDKQNLIFIGIKSTFLFEAQKAGRKVFLLVGDNFPRYFVSGEISSEININNLNSLLEDPIFNKIKYC